MGCLVFLTPSILGRRSTLRYRSLSARDSDDPVRVVVGKEKREFLVEPFVLEENPFRVLIDLVTSKNESKGSRISVDAKNVVLVDVDAILFEHMLWLMQNDSSSLFQLNLNEIIDFYAQDF